MEWPKGIKPRPYQVEAAEALVAALEGGDISLLSAPTGWGKTLVTLVSLKAARMLPATWLVRSLSLASRIEEDAALLGLRTFTLLGREKCCPLYERLGEDVYDYCRYYRHRCRYFLSVDPEKALQAVDWRELLGWGMCPYFGGELAASRADVTVQSYWRRRRITKAIVVDEAHNLLQPREISYPLSKLPDVLRELKKLGASFHLVEKLERLAELDDGPIDVKLLLSEEVLEELAELYLTAIREGRKVGLGRFLRVVGTDAQYIESGKLMGLKASPLKLQRPAVLLSATMPELGRRLLGVEVEVKVPMTKRIAYVLPWLTTKYDEFYENVKEYRNLLTVLKLAGKVVVFGSHRVISVLRRKADLFEEDLVEPPRDWRGVLMLKARGRFSEGVNLEAPVVAILGCPFLPPGAASRLARAYRRMGVENYWEMARDVPMLITTLQCIGRATRTPGSNPLILLADYRFKRYEKQLEEYLELNEIRSLEDVRKEINKLSSN